MNRGQIDGRSFARLGSGQRSRPLVFCGTEGETEENYAKFLERNHLEGVNIKSQTLGGHGRELIDKTLEAAKFYQRSRARKITHLATIYDLEDASDTALNQALHDLDYGQRKNVAVFINCPVVERWFGQHYKKLSAYLSTAEIKRALNSTSMPAALREYEKPGNNAFFTEIHSQIDTALKNYTHGQLQHQNIIIPGMPEFIFFLKNLEQTE